MTIETKTREGAKVNSRLAAFSEYRVDPQNIAVGNTAPIGSLTFEQMDLGVWYPNTEAAIINITNTTIISRIIPILARTAASKNAFVIGNINDTILFLLKIPTFKKNNIGIIYIIHPYIIALRL